MRATLILLTVILLAIPAITTAGPATTPATKPASRPAARFIDRGDFVEDTTTGLLWQKDGAVSGNKNFYQAQEYAQRLVLNDMDGWRLPTREEMAGIFPADQAPFVNTAYNPERYSGKGDGVWVSYWTGDPDTRSVDYAYVYQWYAKGGANNCFARKNFVRVRCVHDPLKK